MALAALVRRVLSQSKAKRLALVMTLGVVGAALFYGDSVITPAISVLSAVEGSEGRLSGAARRRASALDRDPGGALRGPALGHRTRRKPLRTGDAGVVSGDRRRGGTRGCGASERPARAVSELCRCLHRRPPLHRLHRDGRGRARHHRRGSAVRRSEPLRPAAHPPGVVPHRLPGADAQLPGARVRSSCATRRRGRIRSSCSCRTGRRSRWSRWRRWRPSSRRKPSSPARSRCRARRCGSASFRTYGQAHVGEAGGPGIRARGQLGTVRGRAGGDADLPRVGAAGDRVRGRGHRDVRHHYGPAASVARVAVALAALADRRGRRRFRARGADVSSSPT